MSETKPVRSSSVGFILNLGLQDHIGDCSLTGNEFQANQAKYISFYT